MQAGADGEWNPGHIVLAWRAWLTRPIDRLAGSRRWSWWTGLWAFSVGILVDGLNPRADASSEQWRYIIDHTRGDLVAPAVPGSREANLTFRIVPRLVGRVLHLSSPYQFLIVQWLLAIVMLAVIARLLDEALDDRRAAVVGTFGAVGLWAVASAWTDPRGNFDAAAVLLLLVAMLVRKPPLILVGALAATFVDERAFIVAPLVALWHLLRDDDPRQPKAMRDLAWVPALTVVAAMAAHLVIRSWLKARYGVGEGQNRSPGDPWTQLNNYPNGIWGALEGYWLVALAGLATMWRSGRRLLATGASLVIGVTLLVGVSVFDISRSVGFIFPIVPVALLAMRPVERSWKESLLWVAAAVSLLWPLLYAADDRTVVWEYPLPLLIVDWAMNG